MSRATDRPAIIDYASPASRTSLRLPARSEIRWQYEPDGALRVVQVLAGRDGAFVALLFAGFTFVTLALAGHGMLEKWHRNIIPLGLVLLVMAAEAWVGALVVNSTWRKTILTVTVESLLLEMTAPFATGQRYRIAGEQFAGVFVVDRPPLAGEAIVPELEIRLWSMPSLQLFAGHPRDTLMRLAAAIGAIHRVDPPPLPGQR